MAMMIRRMRSFRLRILTERSTFTLTTSLRSCIFKHTRISKARCTHAFHTEHVPGQGDVDAQHKQGEMHQAYTMGFDC